VPGQKNTPEKRKNISISRQWCEALSESGGL